MMVTNSIKNKMTKLFRNVLIFIYPKVQFYLLEKKNIYKY